MNRQIRHLAVVAGVMILALLANASVMGIIRQPGLDRDPRNRRSQDWEFGQNRGPIQVGDAQIAITTAVQDRFRFQRSYPQGPLYAHISGYYAYDYGRSGLEATYGQELAGAAASQTLDRFVDLATGATPAGATVQTTLNPKLQQAAARQLGSRKGAVVALDPKTGAVLALVSSPSYDPNAIASHDLPSAKATWDRLLADPHKPLANRAVREIYPPGSTFKLVTAAAALENGVAPDALIDSPARLPLPGSSAGLTNQVDCGGDQVTIDQALQVSCNTAFANLGRQIGPDRLRAQAQKFGFGSRQLSDLNGVASRFPDKVDQPQLMMSAIGQYEVAATPLQMAMVVAAISNDGVLKSPYLVSEVLSPQLRVLYRHGPDDQRAMSTENARLLQQMMVNTVEHGTGSRAQVDRVVVGGKTGTAQTDPARPPYAWFVAFAKDPDLVVAVFVEEAGIERSDIAGGRVAGPVAKAVIEASR